MKATTPIIGTGSAERHFVILNDHGLHARAATRFVQTASRFKADVVVEKDGRRIDGKSVMSVLMLMAAKGSTISVHSQGADAEPALDALEALIRSKFETSDS